MDPINRISTKQEYKHSKLQDSQSDPKQNISLCQTLASFTYIQHCPLQSLDGKRHIVLSSTSNMGLLWFNTNKIRKPVIAYNHPPKYKLVVKKMK